MQFGEGDVDRGANEESTAIGHSTPRDRLGSDPDEAPADPPLHEHVEREHDDEAAHQTGTDFHSEIAG